MLLLVVGGVMSVSAQITESGKIKVYIQNNLGWSKMYIHYWDGTGTASNWPGEDITSSTELIDGITWHVKVFDGTKGWKIKVHNGDGTGSNDWDTQIYGDTFFDVNSNNGIWLTKQNRYYLYNYQSGLSWKLSKTSSWADWEVIYDNQTDPKDIVFVLANSYAYDTDDTLVLGHLPTFKDL